jgi:hypothetical protein
MAYAVSLAEIMGNLKIDSVTENPDLWLQSLLHSAQPS